MTSVEDATNILRTFRKNHYFLNSKAISTPSLSRNDSRRVYSEWSETGRPQNGGWSVLLLSDDR